MYLMKDMISIPIGKLGLQLKYDTLNIIWVASNKKVETKTIFE